MKKKKKMLETQKCGSKNGTWFILWFMIDVQKADELNK